MNTRFLDKWATQRRKGLLDLCVPNAVARRRIYEYHAAEDLRLPRG